MTHSLRSCCSLHVHLLDVSAIFVFNSFYGAAVNVTALRYMPMWGVEESQAPDGSRVIQYKGSDYQLLSAVADGLNFTFRVLPSQSSAEVRKKEKKKLSCVSSKFKLVF